METIFILLLHTNIMTFAEYTYVYPKAYDSKIECQIQGHLIKSYHIKNKIDLPTDFHCLKSKRNKSYYFPPNNKNNYIKHYDMEALCGY